MTRPYIREARLRPDAIVRCQFCDQEIPNRKLNRKQSTCYDCKKARKKEKLLQLHATNT